MIKKIITCFLLFGCAFFLSCIDSKTKETKDENFIKTQNSYNKINCIKKEDKEIIIQKIMNTKALQAYVEPIINHSIDIQLLKGEFITQDLQIYLNGNQVVIQDLKDITDYTFNLDFIGIDCKRQNFLFSIWYPFEHALINGEVKKQNNKWIVFVKKSGIVN